MPIEQIFEKFKSNYLSSVQPYLNEEPLTNTSQFIAYTALSNGVGLYITPNREELKTYHSGPNFIREMENLKLSLEKKEVNPYSIKIFEVFLAQIFLAIKSNNKFASS